MESARQLRTYDHRLKELVRHTRDITIATQLGVPRSTASGWLSLVRKPVLSSPRLEIANERAHAEIAVLQRRVRRLTALLRVMFAVLRACRIDLSNARIPNDSDKRRLLRSVEGARASLRLRLVIAPLGMSVSRFYAWKRLDRACELQDMPSCPNSSPQQLSPVEVRTIREMVTSPEYRHIPTGTLAILAQRMERVFASPTTWYRLVRTHGWRRPRLRVYPQKPRLGIRANEPDETWHVDATVIKLLNGTKTYLHGVIDNYSRRILAWRLTKRFDTGSTVIILEEAIRSRDPCETPPMVLVDGGVENMNRGVDALAASGTIRRVLAQTDLHFSNSMIESFWKALKHQWLYLNQLDSIVKLRGLVAFYVQQHNEVLPHSAFRGQTPNEMYFGAEENIEEELLAARTDARETRLAINRDLSCGACSRPKGEDFARA